mmetsp:Transcript_32276/g.90385  ORF Transcript_32276/g.90385 Transcript_32276/m.90385 type:complete len:380 (-) Transcript_32276:449-1588(-)
MTKYLVQRSPRCGPLESEPLTSATRGLRGRTRRLRDFQSDDCLRICRMNSNGLDEVIIGGPQFDSRSKALGNLTSVVAEIVKPNDTIVLLLVTDQFGVRERPIALHVNGPNERLPKLVVHLHILLSKTFDGNLLREANHAVLHWREHRGGNIVVVHLHLGISKKTAREQSARLDSGGGQLGYVIGAVAKGIYVLHVGLLVRHQDLAVCVRLHVGGIQIYACQIGVAARREKDCVKIVRLVLPPLHPDATIIHLGQFLGGLLENELHPVVRHVLSDHIRHLLVEAAEKNRSDHHRDIVPESSEKSCALQCNIRGSNTQGFARRVIKRENVVTRNGMLLRARHIRVLRTSSNADEEVLGRMACFLPLAVRALDRVGVHEAR